MRETLALASEYIIIIAQVLYFVKYMLPPCFGYLNEPKKLERYFDV